MVVLTLRRLMRSAVVALLLTWGFSALVGASADQSLLLLFGGLLLGVHAFLGLLPVPPSSQRCVEHAGVV